MTQKVLRVGNSAAVTISRKSLEELGLEIGDRVAVEVNKRQRTVAIRPLMAHIDRELLDWTRKFIKRYRPALEALSKK